MRAGNTLNYFVIQQNEALSFKFTSPNIDAAGGFTYADSSGSGGNIRPIFISITTAPCNFDVSKVPVGPNQDSCFQTGLNGLGINWAAIAGSVPSSYCRLQKNTTYYVNFRFQDARTVAEGGSPTTDSCIGGNCGGVIQFQ